MNIQPVYRPLVAPDRLHLAIRTSSTPFRRELQSRATILSNLPVLDRPARTPSPALTRTIRSSSSKLKTPKSGAINGKTFTAMKALWALGMGYAIYDINEMMQMWPREVRNDIKAAVQAKQKEDWRTAASYFERAYDTALALPNPVASFGADHAIKTSAIALSLGDVLESAGDLPKAYSVYGRAFADLTHGLPSPSEFATSLEADQRARAIGTALKMAELGEQILSGRAPGRAPDDSNCGPADKAEVEKKFRWALTEALRLRTASVKPSEKGKNKELDTLDLPEWVKTVDLMSILDRVAEYYSRKGKLELAFSLYVYTRLALLPLLKPKFFCPFSSTPSIDVMVSFNVGVLSEMSNEHEKARAYYEHALEVSKAVGMDEGVAKAQYALSRLKSQPSSRLS
ncbi:hypothetical protein M407DRAFT_33592 [Tulasnella calospora MUT 4182]|uniref:Uncharacterized protein n=1 Tax=Tulasnella calospora MUT 4182 TaxID=1051891 RepID=A0A0C3PQC7_9AGAM|nr:hypothetical protein M407DRAFT_33592 [Tulasnella calospora MUT 4182]